MRLPRRQVVWFCRGPWRDLFNKRNSLSRGVFFQQNRGTIGMCSGCGVRGAPTTARRHVAADRHSQRLKRRPARRSPSLPPSPASIIARLLNAAAKSSAWTFTATTRARAQLTQVPPRRTTGWCPYWAVVPHGRTHCPHSTWRDGQRRPPARRHRGPQLSSGSGREPEFGLRPQHSP